MMVAALGLASVAAFLVALWIVRIVPVAAGSLVTVRKTVAELRDPALDDLAREKTARRAAVRLFGGFISILIRSLIALAVAFLPIYLGHMFGMASRGAVAVFLARWDVIVGVSVAVCLFAYIKVRFWPRK